MDKLFKGAVAVSALLLTASSRQAHQRASILTPTTTAIKDCGPRPDKRVMGVIRIWLPEHLDLAHLPLENVRIDTASQPDEDSIDEQSGMVGELDNQYTKAGQPVQRVQPFHLYLKHYLVDHDIHGWVAVRIINPPGSDYVFYDPYPNDTSTTAIHGVGDGSDRNDTAICGNPPISQSVIGPDKRIGSFSITLDLMTDQGRSFNIGLTPKTANETPIFIDPKIHNDG